MTMEYTAGDFVRMGFGFDNPNHAASISSKGVAYLNDALGTTVGARRGARYSAAALTAFGEGGGRHAFFTGKPLVEGLGRAFLMRNYRADLAKWQTADPLGYPDGWNPLAYGVNSPVGGFDLLGAAWSNADFVGYYFDQDPARSNDIDTNQMGLTDQVLPVVRSAAAERIDLMVQSLINAVDQNRGHVSQVINLQFSVDCGPIVWAMGGGIGRTIGHLVYDWWIECFWYAGHLYEKKAYSWQFKGGLEYEDEFKDPADILNIIEVDFEVPFGRPYRYGHVWDNQFLYGDGYSWSRMVE